MTNLNDLTNTLEKVREQRGVEVRRYNALQKELKEYKELLEKQLKVTANDAPTSFCTHAEETAWVQGVKSTALYALEMLPQVEYEDTVSSKP